MSDGPIALCGVCRRACFHWGVTMYCREPFDSGWSHFAHPSDNHDALPLITDWADVNERICLAAEEGEDRDLLALTCPWYQGVESCVGGSCRAACKSGFTTGWLSSEDAARHDLQKFHIELMERE